MADIRIIDMPDLDMNIPQENIYLVVDEASQTYKVMVKNVAVPYTSAATHKQALIYSSATNSVEWGYVSGIPGGSNGQVQYNNNGILDGFGSWDGSIFTVPRIKVEDSFQVGNNLVISPFTSAGFSGTRLDLGIGTTSHKAMLQYVVTSAGNDDTLQLICDYNIDFSDSENVYTRSPYASFGPAQNRYFILTRADKGLVLGNVDTPIESLVYYSSADNELKYQEDGKQLLLISNPRDLAYTVNSNLETSGFNTYFHRNGKITFSGVILSTSAVNEINEDELLFTIDNSDAWPAQTLYLMVSVGSNSWEVSKPDGVSYIRLDTSGNVYMGAGLVNSPVPYVIWMDGVSYQSANTVTL